MPRRTIPAELLALLQGRLLPVADRLPGLLRQVKKLPLDRDAVWLLLTQQLTAPGAEEGLPTALALLDLTSGALLYQDMLENANTADLTWLVLETMLEPVPATREGGGWTMTLRPVPARQPARLLAPDARVAQSLAAELASLKVKVMHDDSPQTARLLTALMEPFKAALDAQAGAMSALPCLTGQPDDAVLALHVAMGAYCHAQTWAVFDPLKLVRATWIDGEGETRQCCASVMGAAGESFGLALYARADAWAVILQSGDPEASLAALSGMKRVWLGEAFELAPEDLARLTRLGLEPIQVKDVTGWPVLQRLSHNDAPEAEIAVRTVLPATPLSITAALLQTLADRARARPASRVMSLTARRRFQRSGAARGSARDY